MFERTRQLLTNEINRLSLTITELETMPTREDCEPTDHRLPPLRERVEDYKQALQALQK